MTLVTQFQDILDLETEDLAVTAGLKLEGTRAPRESPIGAEQYSFRRVVNHTAVSSGPEQWVWTRAGLKPQVRACRSMCWEEWT